jgi:thiol-disulfide isomerase/thioredoxin
MKQLVGIVCLVSLWGIGMTYLFPAFEVYARSKVLVEVLARPDCPHCQEEEEFLERLAEERDDFETRIYNIYLPEDRSLWERLTDLEGVSKVTPITVIGNDVLIGFATRETTGAQIIQLIEEYQDKDTWTVAEFIESGGSGRNAPKLHEDVSADDGTCEEECVIQPKNFYVTIPIVGNTIDVLRYSLPMMSIILGFIDGFNPCAMWVLVSFLVILAQLGSRKKMWLFAGIFILAEAIMYTLILTVWFSTWDFIGLDRIVTPLVGLVSIAGGCFFLYEWKTSAPGECKVTNQEQKRKTSLKIKELASQRFTILTFLGIILLAFSVNVIEFACSIGIPQAFTKILELNNFSLWQSSGYIFLYILFYMVDDFIVFGIALYSFEKIGITGKYTKISNLIGGILMLILGGLLIFKPGWLMFA